MMTGPDSWCRVRCVYYLHLDTFTLILLLYFISSSRLNLLTCAFYVEFSCKRLIAALTLSVRASCIFVCERTGVCEHENSS